MEREVDAVVERQFDAMIEEAQRGGASETRSRRIAGTVERRAG